MTARTTAMTLALGALVMHAAPAMAQGVVTIEGERIFPESLDAGKDGALYIGSIGKSSVFRALKGENKATLWIEKKAGGISSITGVVADDANGRLWICSSDMNSLGETVSLKAFDIKTGAPKADYPFPENKGLCNDIVITKDGVVYATDTPNSRIFRLKPGATALEFWVSDPRFEGIDGIALLPGGHLFVNNVRTGLLFKVEVKADGSAGAVTEVPTSRPLEGPDGLRPTPDGRYLIAENRGGKISIGTFVGDKLQIDTLKEGLEGPPGVTIAGTTIYALEAKSKYRNDPAFKDKDAGPFVLTPIALPPKK